MILSPDRTVGEIAAEYPAATSVFEQHHIDYWCGGNHSLREACRVGGARAWDVVEEIKTGAPPLESRDSNNDWSTTPLWQLAAHLMNRHHACLRRQMSCIEQMM